MKNLTRLIALGLMVFGLAAQANVRVAEAVVERLATASRSEQLFANLGLQGMNALTTTEQVARLNTLLARGDASAQAVGRQMQVFEAALRAGSSVEAAFSQAFVRGDAVLSMTNIHQFAEASAAETGGVIAGVLDTVETSQDRQAPACVMSIVNNMDSQIIDRGAFRNALRTAELSLGGPLLGEVSCGTTDVQIANGVGQLVIALEAELLRGNETLVEDLVAVYARRMGVDEATALSNLRYLKDNCGVFSDRVAL